MPRIRRCRRCYRPVDDDGYGELIHAETGRYGCDINDDEEGYPVAV